jgi:hypothetical protein
MMRLALALGLAGCFIAPQHDVASPPGVQVAQSDSPVVCRRETPTGSLISRMVCREASNPDDEFNRDTIQRALEVPRPNVRGRR